MWGKIQNNHKRSFYGGNIIERFFKEITMTNQEIFDQVYRHFVLESGKPSFTRDPITEEISCKYRGPDGARCAAGLFIPDDKYDPKCEGFQCDKAFEKLNFNFNGDLAFLLKLQQLHDILCRSDSFKEEMEEGLKFLADNENLTIPTS